MKQYLPEFKDYLLSEKGASLNTVEAYLRDISTFLDSFPNANSREDIVAWIGRKKEEKYLESSIKRFLIAIKVFYAFLKREGFIKEDPAERIMTPKLWRKLPVVLSEAEVDQLLAIFPKDEFYGLRDRAIFELLYSSGLRVSELTALHLSDIQKDFIQLHGKGGKERLVPMGKAAISAIEDWLLFRPEDQTHPDPLLFISKKGKGLTRFEVFRQLRFWAKKAGIMKKISPHTFRHTFATHLLKGGADLRVIQDLLGHSSIASTDLYTQVDRSQLQSAFEALHPRFSS